MFYNVERSGFQTFLLPAHKITAAETCDCRYFWFVFADFANNAVKHQHKNNYDVYSRP